MTRAPTMTLLLALAAATAGCRSRGPSLTLRNPDGHALFVDGRRVMRARAARQDRSAQDRPEAAPLAAEPPTPAGTAPSADDQPTHVELPFRYYGASRWDVLPRVIEDNGVPVFDARPRSEAVALPPPVSPWLFPLDFPLEAIDRLFFGPRDVDVIVTARTRSTPAEEIRQQDFGELSARARAARSDR